MIYRLDDKVFLVKGVKKSCIYDMRDCYTDLYCVDNSILNRSNWVDKLSSLLDISISKEFFEEEVKIDVNKSVHIDFAWIEITSVCNLRCKYCYLGSKSRTFVNAADFKQVLNFLKKFGCRKIQLIGGEPLCHPHIFELLDISLNKGFEVSIYTNGVLLKASDIEFLSKLGIKVNIGISFEDSLEKVRKVIFHCKEKGILRKVSATITKYNSDFNFADFLKDAYDLFKPDIVRITSPSGLFFYNKKLLERKLITLEYFRKKKKSSYIYRNMRYHNCFYGKLYVSSELKLYPCPMVRKISMGSLTDLTYKQFIENWLAITSTTKDKIFFCRKCEFRYACFDCRYDVWGKIFYNRPWYCSYNPLAGKWINKDVYLNKYLLRRLKMEGVILLTDQKNDTSVTEEVEFCAPGYCGPVEE